VRVVDLELVSGVGDEDDEELGRFGRARVLGEDVMRARLLDPTLARAEGSDGLVVDLAAHSALEDVGVDERVKVLPGTFGRACRCTGVRLSAGGDAVPAIGVVTAAGWSGVTPARSWVEQAVAPTSVTTASRLPAIRILVTSSLLYAVRHRE
jgi:hypothetical protein